jgi:hypothetical protein
MFLINARKNRRSIENEQSRETGNIWHTRHVTKINREWTIQRNWQHLAHRTHDENKQKQNTTQKKDEHNGHHERSP